MKTERNASATQKKPKHQTSLGLSFSNAVVWVTDAAVLYPQQLSTMLCGILSPVMLIQQNNGKKTPQKPPPNNKKKPLTVTTAPLHIFSYLALRHCNKKTLPIKHQLFNKCYGEALNGYNAILPGEIHSCSLCRHIKTFPCLKYHRNWKFIGVTPSLKK